jgi:hypothetical protein
MGVLVAIDPFRRKTKGDKPEQFCSYDAEIPCWMYRMLQSFWRGHKLDHSRNSLLLIVSGKSMS